MSLTPFKRKQILFAVAIGTFIAPLDASVVNIALPSISEYYQVSVATAEWIVMIYLLVISSLLLSYGRMGDLYGYKKIYLSGFAVFTIGSLFSAISPNINLLIAFRAFQALGAGMLMAMGPAIITEITPREERGRALGTTAVAVSVALTAGPVIGGLLTTHFGWPSIFLINLPIGFIGMLWANRVIPHLRGGERQSFDFIGAALLALALTSILFALSYSAKTGWKGPLIWAGFIFGFALLIVFVLLEKRLQQPMIDLSLFQNRLFSMGNLSALFNFMAQFSVTLLMPFYLQQVLDLSPSRAGLFMIPMPVVNIVVAPLSGALSDRYDTRYVSSLGMAIVALGLGLLSTLRANSTEIYIVVCLLITGLGVGMFQTPNNSAIMGSVPPNRRGTASGMLATTRNIGMVLGIAISGAIFTTRQNQLFVTMAGLGVSGRELQTQAFMGGINLAFLVGAVLALVAVFASMVRGSLHGDRKQ